MIAVLFAAVLCVTASLAHAAEPPPPVVPATPGALLDALPASLVTYVGQTILVRSPDTTRIAVGSGKVLSARIVDRQHLLLIALDAGDTTLHVWNKQGTLRKLALRVNVSNQDRIVAELREMTANMPGVSIRPVGQKVLIDGDKLDAAAVAKLGTLAKLYPEAVLLANADSLRTERMVDIQVRIMEFSRTGLDELGTDWQTSADGLNFGVFSDIASSGNFRILPKDSSFSPGNTTSANGSEYPGAGWVRRPQAYLGLASTLSSKINLLVQRGKAAVIASPNLSTRSGGEAKFLAGGEVPLPAVGTNGSGNVTFKPYGVLLNIKPVADEEGRIGGSILTEVSSIDPSVTVNNIPGLMIRRTDTEFSVRAGETIVLSGLSNLESARSSNGLPGLRNIPLLGRAFRSDTNRDREQEIVVFITPRVVTVDDSRAPIARAEKELGDFRRRAGNLNDDHDPKSADIPEGR